MTTHITDRSSAQPVGPPPPFDPELAPVIEVLTSLRSPPGPPEWNAMVTLDTSRWWRDPGAVRV